MIDVMGGQAHMTVSWIVPMDSAYTLGQAQTARDGWRNARGNLAGSPYHRGGRGAGL